MIKCKTGIEPLGPVDYDKPPPDTYRCSSCGQKGRRLWRDYNTFLDHQRLLCLSCAKVDQKRTDGRERFGDQIGGMIPAVPTEDGDTFWGYSSVPTPGVAWWYAMAECCTDDDSEGGRQRRRAERWRKAHDGMERLYGYEKKWADEMRAGKDKAETDLVRATAELVACEKERDAMREILADIGNDLAGMDWSEVPSGGALLRFKEAIDAYRKEAK